MQRDNLAPNIVEIGYKDDLHKKVMANFKRRKKLARDEQRKKREQEWEKAENSFTAFIPEKEHDRLRSRRRSEGTPQYTTITLPYSYAMLLTAHTYFTSVFLSRDPIFQVKGRHGEAQTAETAIESLLDYQLTGSRGLANLYIWLMDVGKYGHGILGHYWDKETFRVTRIEDAPREWMGMPIPGTSERKEIISEVTGFEGNKFYNVRPKDFLTDPYVSLLRFQDGEFVIVQDQLAWHTYLSKVAAGEYYNEKAVRANPYRGSRDSAGEGHFSNSPGDDIALYSHDDKNPHAVILDEFHWTVIPSELGIGKNNRPEKWVFTIANEEVIISAQPLGLLHNQYPFDVLTHEIEGYNVFNRGLFEILRPINETMDWLVNSHYYNVRASLNNQYVVDPSKIEMRDLEDPQAGKLIRLKPAAIGGDVRTMISQLPVTDVTGGHIRDMENVAQLAQRITGVSDNIMGSVNAGGRKTATEIRTSSSYGMNRLKTMVEWFSSTGFAPLTQKLIMSTQQLYQAETKIRIVGDQALWMEPYLQVSPDDIAGFYDWVPIDGSIPIDRFAQVNLWQQMLTNLAQVPGMLQQFDMSKIFAYIAQLGGLKNVDRFRVEIMPDAALAAQQQSGNMVPAQPVAESAPGVPSSEPGQIPMMGRTG